MRTERSGRRLLGVRVGAVEMLASALVAGVVVAAPTTRVALVPAYDAFWAAPPKGDVDTAALWSFEPEGGPAHLSEDHAAADLEKLAQAESSSLAGEGMPEPGSPVSLVACVLEGETASESEGRFGAALRLSGRGCVRSETLSLAHAAGSTGRVTLDFWVRPDPVKRESLLATFPTAKQLWRLVRTPDQGLALRGLGGATWTHPTPVPDGVWTHVAVVLADGQSPALLVNGAPASPPEPAASGLRPGLAALGATLVVGGTAQGSKAGGSEGFAGLLDEVRVSRGEHRLYPLETGPESPAAGPARVTAGPPHFVYDRPPVLYLSFDRANAAEGQGARVDGAVSEKDLVEGLRGRALALSRESAAPIRIAGLGLLPYPRGTLELWFRPLIWNSFYEADRYGNGEPVPWFPLLSFAPPGAPSGRALRTVSLARGVQQPMFGLRVPAVRFHPGRWTHLLCVWDGGSARIYLDGAPQPLAQAAFSATAGADPAGKAMEAAWQASASNATEFALTFVRSGTAVDELRIYPWAFSAEEAQNAWARYLPDAARRLTALERVRATSVYDYYNGFLKVGVACLPVANREPESVTVTLRDAAGGAVLGEQSLPLPPTLQTYAYIRKPLEFDRSYPLEITVSAGGQTLSTLSTNVLRPRPAWWTNTLGQDRVVPPPWTPMTASGQTVCVWGRTVALAPGGFPSAIESAGAPLLAAPARLHGQGGERAIEFAATGPAAFGERSADRVTWSGGLAGGGVKVVIAGSAEYDGLVAYRVTLSPADGGTAELQRLTLDFPLTAPHASQLIVNGGGHNFRAAWDVRLLPAGEGRVWDSRNTRFQKGVRVGNFCPVVWLGDDRRGLCFFGENDAGWTPDPAEASQEILREGGAVVYRMRIVTRPVAIASNRTFSFFLHPTPTKPLPDHWRAYNRGQAGVPCGSCEGIDAFISPTLTAPANLPEHAGITFRLEPHSWTDAEFNGRVLRERAGSGNPRLFYIDCSWPQLGPSMTEFMQAGLWTCGRMTWCREVEDYMTWIVNEYIRRDIIDGLYIDDTSLGSTLSRFSTAYLTDAGQEQPGFSTMGFRRFLKRVWTLFALRGKPAYIVPHMTYCYEIPALSFAMAAVNGEDRDIYPFASHTFMDVWPQEQLRIMGGSEKWGFIQFWKCGVSDKAPTASKEALRSWLYWQYRAQQAAMLPHDTAFMWGCRAANRTMMAFGTDAPDTRFLRPHAAADAVKVTGSNVVVTAFVRPGRALLFVTNLARQPQTATVTADPARLFGSEAAGRTVSWRDVDDCPFPPPSGVATREEMKDLTPSTLAALPLGDEGAPREEEIEGLLGGWTPEDKKKAEYAIQPEGLSVVVPLRKQDYRAVEMAIEEEVPR